MLVTYTRDRGLARGVVETFDGEHPCPMCEMAARMKQEESRGNPTEPRREETNRDRLAWAPMLAPAWLRWRSPPGVDFFSAKPVGPLAIAGRGREAPAPPPPRRA
jgi:hypothetical protein